MSVESIIKDENAVEDLRGRFLTFFIGETYYGIELLNIIEIISVQPITYVPGLPIYFKGIINLRGKVVPIIDFRLKFCLPERAYDEKTCIIVVMIQDMQVGLIVDSVAEVISIEDAQKSDPPELGGNGERYLSSIAKVDDKIILNISCEKFFQSDFRTY